MAALTASQIIAEAFRELGVAASGEPVDPDDLLVAGELSLRAVDDHHDPEDEAGDDCGHDDQEQEHDEENACASQCCFACHDVHQWPVL